MRPSLFSKSIENVVPAPATVVAVIVAPRAGEALPVLIVWTVGAPRSPCAASIGGSTGGEDGKESGAGVDEADCLFVVVTRGALTFVDDLGKTVSGDSPVARSKACCSWIPPS